MHERLRASVDSVDYGQLQRREVGTTERHRIHSPALDHYFPPATIAMPMDKWAAYPDTMPVCIKQLFKLLAYYLILGLDEGRGSGASFRARRGLAESGVINFGYRRKRREKEGNLFTRRKERHPSLHRTIQAVV